jgi:hypothetical protein
MDGTGSASNPSGVLLDPSKQNLYILDYVWQGAGRIRFGIMINGGIQYVHQINNSNVITAPYLRSPSKPGRVELSNLGVTASTTTMDIICATAIREAVTDTFAPYSFSAASGATKQTLNSTTVPLPIISIRPKATFNGLTNRVPIRANDFDVFSLQDAAFIQVVLNPTLTGASWVSAGTNSAVEYDISSTAVTGGTVLYQTYVTGGGKGADALTDLSDEIILGLDIAGTTPDVLSIIGTKLAANTDTYAAIRWSEFQ